MAIGIIENSPVQNWLHTLLCPPFMVQYKYVWKNRRR